MAGEKGYAVLIIAASFTLMIMPFYITFNEFLTEVIKSLGLWWFIETYIAPLVARLTASMLNLFGLDVALSGPIIYLNAPSSAVAMYIAWNCIGWQSLVIFSAIAYFVIKEAPLSRIGKLTMVFLGLQGTILVNILRIALVGLIAAWVGKGQAIIFHDYFGSFVTFGWLVLFWFISTRAGGDSIAGT
ncbi:MAG: archaeosortase/exosortase family protein [Nitrososphaerota archaeon]|nr:exosortase/archaeosortase family protein [Aigarchaeota archaeon]MDW8076101.1 archaeosortase/exosortase family protein [Nitrososphaerota archaeon]